MMETIHFTDSWHTTFAGGHVGLLQIGPLAGNLQVASLEAHKRALEASLRRRYDGLGRAELQELEPLRSYKAYYRKFNKSYHVQLQLESVVIKGRTLPAVTPLVDACFAAELETHLLTASHDADKLLPPVTVDASTGDEVLQTMNGGLKQIKARDMMMRDAEGVVCTIIYGQDGRTPVTSETRRVLYVTYAPRGISREAVAAHHDTLIRNVRLFAPDAAVGYQAIVTAGA